MEKNKFEIENICSPFCIECKNLYNFDRFYLLTSLKNRLIIDKLYFE